jgi:hypothetical protein
MDTQAQSFKTIEANNLKLEIYNASENSLWRSIGYCIRQN